MRSNKPALVVAFVALLCSMAGTGYAAATISGKSIKKRSVPANRVVSDALTGKQIKEATLGPVPAAVAAQTAQTAETAKSADKATTAESATTAQTATTAQKAADADQLGGKAPSAYLGSTMRARIFLSINVPANSGVEGTAACLPGETVTGGGGAFYIAGTDTTVGSGTLSTSAPAFDSAGNITGWRAEGKNTSTAARDFRAWVICAS